MYENDWSDRGSTPPRIVSEFIMNFPALKFILPSEKVEGFVDCSWKDCPVDKEKSWRRLGLSREFDKVSKGDEDWTLRLLPCSF
jgi:hypothetical protein